MFFFNIFQSQLSISGNHRPYKGKKAPKNTQNRFKVSFLKALKKFTFKSVVNCTAKFPIVNWTVKLESFDFHVTSYQFCWCIANRLVQKLQKLNFPVFGSNNCSSESMFHIHKGEGQINTFCFLQKKNFIRKCRTTFLLIIIIIIILIITMIIILHCYHQCRNITHLKT